MFGQSRRPKGLWECNASSAKRHEMVEGQSSDIASHLCILAFQSLHFVDKFVTATIAASTFTQLCPYDAGDDLLLGSWEWSYAQKWLFLDHLEHAQYNCDLETSRGNPD
ncbi:hypothetical protein TNCV_1627831 [Trichonephila clavipes]|nr:hypothetical protein TNCV_1627831 [Trichonephila clavipes]